MSWAGIRVTSGYGNNLESEWMIQYNLELSQVTYELFRIASKDAGMQSNLTARAKYCVLFYSCEIVAGMKIIAFQKYLRLGNVFVSLSQRKKGWIPRILQSLCFQYHLPMKVRAYSHMWKYWSRYGDLTQQISPKVAEFTINVESIALYLQKREVIN